MQFIPVMQSWIFSIITPVFSVTFLFTDSLLKKHLLSMLMILWIESSKEQHGIGKKKKKLTSQIFDEEKYIIYSLMF